jgi:hypothetical protein
MNKIEWGRFLLQLVFGNIILASPKKMTLAELPKGVGAIR